MTLAEARKLIDEVNYPLDYNQEEWNGFLGSNCYPYSLGIKTNEAFLVGDLIGRRVTAKDSDSTKLYILKTELQELGFEIEECDVYDVSDEGFKIYFQINDKTGEYHLIRCDIDNLWSHKAADYLPNRRDSAGYIIEDPEAMAEPGFHGWCLMLYRY